MSSTTLEVSGHLIDISRADKPLFADDGITKADLAAYYQRVAEHMLPHVHGRPVAMKRYPEGIHGDGFLHKEVPDHFPSFVRRVELGKQDGTTTYAVIEDAADLVYLADQACITPHVWLATADRPEVPDRMLFDLDPPESELDVLRSALRHLREILTDLELPAFVKSTGSAGAHVEVPLQRRHGFDDAREVAKAIAQLLVDRDPDAFTTRARKERRGDRLYVDIMRNAYAQHAVPPYAVRARTGAPVATPLDWDEAVASDFDPRRYTINNLFRRLARKQDPWASIHREATTLARVRRRLEASG